MLVVGGGGGVVERERDWRARFGMRQAAAARSTTWQARGESQSFCRNADLLQGGRRKVVIDYETNLCQPPAPSMQAPSSTTVHVISRSSSHALLPALPNSRHTNQKTETSKLQR